MTPTSEARPVDAGERLVLLDVLRGFALFGVLAANVDSWLSGLNFLTPAERTAMSAHPTLVDSVAAQVLSLLIHGRFFTIFSFLFGLGFSIQMGRAEARGASVTPVYARRLGVLFLIGLAHIGVLWYGDVLHEYALLGFLLLLFRNLPAKSVLRWAIALTLLVPVLGTLVMRYPAIVGTPEATAAAAKAMGAARMAYFAQARAAFSSSSYLTVRAATADFYLRGVLPMLPPWLGGVFGRFLLGLWAGKRRLFHEPEQHLRFFRRLMGWGFVAAALAEGASFALQKRVLNLLLHQDKVPWQQLPMAALRQVAEIGTASVFVSGLTLLFLSPRGRKVVSIFAPAGRMALSNYLCQSLVSIAFFDGFGLGLLCKLNPAQCLGYSLCLYTVQLVISRIWLASFRFGPMEWVWRSLTYGKAQSMRREAPGAPEARAA